MIRYLWDRMLKWGWDYNRDLRDDGLVESHRPARMRSRGGANSIAICDVTDDNIDLTDPISFKVEAVQGGTLVETRWYDHKRDESIRKLHIVMSDENLAEAIGKIVTMELLKR
jgi:hypothetical protein